MREVLGRLIEAVEAGVGVVCCRLVETRGSTPQKPGATMLVFPDGRQAGTLGGGCVEAEVKRKALAVFAEGDAQIARFQLDNDYGWDDGLICGGRMNVLIDPIRGDDSGDLYRRLAGLIDAGEGATMAVAFDGESASAAEASVALFDEQGAALATRGDWKTPASRRLSESLRPLEDRPGPYVEQGVSFLPILPRCTLVIVGGGHVGLGVARLAATLDFDVCVVDDREEYVAAERFPMATRRLAGPIGEVLPSLAMTPSTYCLIVTRGHNHDEEALCHLVDRGARYVGMIGSRRKIRLIFEDLLEQGVPREALEQVFAPVGLDIGSQTVEEIAISIAAELVAHRNRHGVVPGRPDRVTVAS